MSGSPVRITPNTPSSRWPSAISERRADGEGEADDGQAVGGDPGSVQALADGLEPSLDRRAPASVEHAQNVLGRERCRWCVRGQGNTRASGLPDPGQAGSRTPGRRAPGPRARPRTPGGRAPGPRGGRARGPGGAATDLRRLDPRSVTRPTGSRALGGAGGGHRRSRRRRSATWPWSATAGRARPRSPRPSSSPPGRSPVSGRWRTATPPPTSTPKRRGDASRCRWPSRRSSTTVTRST